MAENLSTHLTDIATILEEFAGRLNAKTDEALRAAEEHTVKATDRTLLAIELVDSLANGLHEVAKTIAVLDDF